MSTKVEETIIKRHLQAASSIVTASNVKEVTQVNTGHTKRNRVAYMGIHGTKNAEEIAIQSKSKRRNPNFSNKRKCNLSCAKSVDKKLWKLLTKIKIEDNQVNWQHDIITRSY